MDKIYIAPSTDPAKDIDTLKNYVKEISPYADFLHCDVMDGEFVKRKTIDENEIKIISSIISMPLDVHLMVKNPKKDVNKYLATNASIITVHYEAFKSARQLIKCLKKIRKHKKLAGLSINPQTDIDEIYEFLSYVDLVLVMSVNPGLSGQKFIEKTNNKILKLSEIKQNYNSNFLIEVDGGINDSNAQKIILHGANILVSGSYVFNAQNKKQAIENLKF